MFKKVLGLSLIVSSVFLGGPATYAETVELKFWSEYSGEPHGPTMDKIVAAFNQANPDIQVTHTKFQNSPYETAIKAAYAGGEPPDIANINGGADTFQFAQAGELLDLSEFVGAKSDLIIPGLDAMYNYLGKTYGIPWELNLGNMLYYNTKMLAEQNIEPESIKSWGGFLAAAEKFKQAGIAPIAFGNKEKWPGNHWYTHLLRRMVTTEEYVKLASQSLVPSVKSPIKWNDNRSVKAWEMYVDLKDKGYFSKGYLSDDFSSAGVLFENGGAPFFQTGSWLDKPDHADFIIFPSIEGTPGKQTDIVNHSQVIAISKRSKHPNEAKRFLGFLMGEEAAKIWATSVGPVPFIHDTSDWKLDPFRSKILEKLGQATSAAPFIDILEDRLCNSEHTSEASVAMLTGDLTPLESTTDHEQCVRDLRADRDWE